MCEKAVQKGSRDASEQTLLLAGSFQDCQKRIRAAQLKWRQDREGRFHRGVCGRSDQRRKRQTQTEGKLMTHFPHSLTHFSI